MKKAAVIKILEKYDIDEYHYKLEIADEIVALEQQSKEQLKYKCHKIYDKTKEAWTPDKRTFEQAEKENKETYQSQVNEFIEEELTNNNTSLYCVCANPNREAGYSYCMACHRHVSPQRMEFLTSGQESKGTELHPVDMEQVMGKQESVEEILAKCACIDLKELEFKNEVQIIRPSEAIEAMQEYATKNRREALIKFIMYFKNNAAKDIEGVGSIDGDQYLLNWIPTESDIDEYLKLKL